ncbi:MAG: hypothetical protein GX621_02250, partial [Pirellulaceae bacterium]|nr:hypothetical protein [Pirellulaceae bacterium]
PVDEGTLAPATQIITLSGWYKPQDVAGDGSDSWLYVWEASPGFTVSMSINTGDSIPSQRNPRWAYGARNNFNDLAGPEYNQNDWNHVVTVFNSVTKRAKFYHNGVLRDYRAIPDDILMTLSASTEFYIGTGRASLQDRNFDGYIDEVALFDHEPSAEVIAGLYDGTYTPATAPSDEAAPPSLNIRSGWTLDDTIAFVRPAGMAINPVDGKLYVARRGNTGVSSAGTVESNIFAIESDGSATAVLDSEAPDRPHGLVINSTGEIFWSEDYDGRIATFGDPELDPIRPWVTEFHGSGVDADPGAMAIVPAGFDGGLGSLVNPGDAIVVDAGVGGFEKIFVWSTTFSEMKWILHDDLDEADGVGSPLMEPHGLAISDSAIYVSDRLGDAIYTLDPTDGTLTELTTSRLLASPMGMAVDPISNDLFVIIDDDGMPGSELVRINTATGQVSTVIDMLTDMDKFCETWPVSMPQMVFSTDGEYLYVIEPEADVIHRLARSTAPPTVPGDTNNDGIVDDVDAKVLAANWGKLVAQGDVTAGDFNNDGVVNALDASILAAQWGNHNTTESASAVPEPSAMVVLLGMAIVSLARRRG